MSIRIFHPTQGSHYTSRRKELGFEEGYSWMEGDAADAEDVVVKEDGDQVTAVMLRINMGRIMAMLMKRPRIF